MKLEGLGSLEPESEAGVWSPVILMNIGLTIIMYMCKYMISEAVAGVVNK